MADRAGRITASMVHKVLKRKARTPPDNLVRSILMYDINSKIVLRKNDPREHGRLMEPVAREAYIACSDSCRIVSENGLYVHLEKPYLAASPDGIVVDESVEYPGLLEIKCPLSKLPVDALASQQRKFCLIMDEHGLKLNVNHQYYSQIQMQMAVTGHMWTDFVVFTDTDDGPSVFVQRIQFSNIFWDATEKCVSKFYEQFVVLELLTRRVKRNKKLLP